MSKNILKLMEEHLKTIEDILTMLMRFKRRNKILLIMLGLKNLIKPIK